MSNVKQKTYRLLIVLLLLAFLFVARVPARAAATINVTTKEDEFNSDGWCSLREAIIAANENRAVGTGCPAGTTGVDIIMVPTGIYSLRLRGVDDSTRLGDLDISGDVIIQGSGTGKTIIDGFEMGDRVFHILSLSPPLLTKVSFNSLSIQNGNISGSLSANGGGIYNDGGDLTLDFVVLLGNKASFAGGGIYNPPGSILMIRNSQLLLGSARSGGGIANEGTLSINSSVIYRNVGSQSGGGLNNTASADAQVQLVNVTIAQNISSDAGGQNAGGGGAGIFNSGPLRIYSSTITQNIGYGLQFQSNTSGEIKNTIIANQISSPNCGFNTATMPFPAGGYNMEDSNTCKLGLENGNLEDQGVLGVGLDDHLADNGGLTPTYKLMENSPAIDHGTNLGCPASDQRWSIRPWDGDNEIGAICDIGAYEYSIGMQVRSIFLPQAQR